MTKFIFGLMAIIGFAAILIMGTETDTVTAFWVSRASAISVLAALLLFGHELNKHGFFDGFISKDDNQA